MDRSRHTSRIQSTRIYCGVVRLLTLVRRHWSKLTFIGAAALILPAVTFIACWWMFPFPLEKLDPPSNSIVVTDRSGHVMLELAGVDGQRRRPVALDSMSPWLLKAIVAIEDERFDSHRGVDVCAILRATGQNLQARRQVSGASTITMQLCKMIDERPRTWRAKLIESFRALQLEQQRTKKQILTDYLNLIPCGGNLRGVEAASQAYFGKRAKELSLAEAALLAGLPQSPNRYAPDRHPEAAKLRRNMVLNRMLEQGDISQAQHDDALREPVVVRSRVTKTPLATHAAWMALAQRPTGGATTIDIDLQQEVETVVRDSTNALPEDADAAVVIIDVATGKIVALLGSANNQDPKDGQVNGATARRSPGSTLKPFLYAAAFEARRLSPDSMVDDVAIERAGWSPENFDRTYRGSITASEALRQSLNVPAITITEGLGLPRCLGVLASVGLELPADAEARGGLAVATGGLDVSLLELTNAYATLAREGLHRDTSLLLDDITTQPEATRVLDGNVCRAITSVLSSEHRSPNGWAPELRDGTWYAWKTGTSSGRRDAWAVGHNGRFAVGVWIGNFQGAGHHQFVGRDTAEPILSRLFGSKSLAPVATIPTYDKWDVTTPLPRPKEARGQLVILSPRQDTTFLAMNGSAVIHPSASSQDPLTWFHNGRLLTASEASRLVVSRGAHELRAVALSGQATAVRFVVK